CRPAGGARRARGEVPHADPRSGEGFVRRAGEQQPCHSGASARRRTIEGRMSLLNASSPSPAQPLAPSRPTSTGPSRGLRALQPGAQSRRRPTALYALTAVVTVFAIVGLQLVLSVAIAQGAFQAERLESEAG